MDKVRIYIVDDEWMAVEYLKALLKEASPAYEVVGEAFQGIMAYEQILTLRPDIVFVDIQMPVMNGLELAEKIMKKEYTPAVIFLTSYREFDFVKKGMDLGVSAYLLKNELSAELLKKEIDKIIKDMEIERRKAYMYAEYNIKNFLFSSTGPEVPTANKASLERYAVLLFVRDTPLLIEEKNTEMTHMDVMGMENLKYGEGLRCRHIAEIESGKWYAIFYIAPSVSQSEELLIKAGERIQNEFLKREISVSFFYDEAVRDKMLLPSRFQNMYRFCENAFFYGKGKCLHIKQAAGRDGETETDIHLAAFLYALEEADENASCYIVEKILDAAEKNGNLPEYRKLVLELAGSLRRYCERQKVEFPSDMEKTVFENTGEVKKWLLEGVAQIFRQVNEQKERHFSPAVGLAAEYIMQNYHKNISVQDIAAFAGISEGHLRKCFKNEMNLTVVDYLTEYRIRKAKSLMKKGKYKISDIYEMTGFTSSQYFSYVFKKIEGKTPSEYMKSL